MSKPQSIIAQALESRSDERTKAELLKFDRIAELSKSAGIDLELLHGDETAKSAITTINSSEISSNPQLTALQSDATVTKVDGLAKFTTESPSLNLRMLAHGDYYIIGEDDKGETKIAHPFCSMDGDLVYLTSLAITLKNLGFRSFDFFGCQTGVKLSSTLAAKGEDEEEKKQKQIPAQSQTHY